MAKKIKSQIGQFSKFSKFIQFSKIKCPSWIVIGLLVVVFIFIMYNQYKEGFTFTVPTPTVPTVPTRRSTGDTGSTGATGSGATGSTGSGNTLTSTQIQARELVKRWEDQLTNDKTANNMHAAQADQYNIEFYKSMS